MDQGKFTLLAIRDFEPSQLNRREKEELRFISKRIGYSEQISHEQHLRNGTGERHQQPPEESESKKHSYIQSDKEECDDNKNAELVDLSMQDDRSASKDDLRTSDKVCSIRDEKSDIRDQEEAKTTEELETVMVQEELTSLVDLESASSSDESSESEVDLQSISACSSESEDGHVYKTALTFKTGDKMETIRPENIGDIDGWWRVKHLDNGNTGYIPRNCVVLERDCQPSETTLNDLPLELQDYVLGKSYLHWILNSSPEQRDRDVIKALASVNFCLFQRLKRRRFKKRIWNQLKAFYEKAKRRTTIIRSSRNYFMENIHLNDEMILLLNYIANEQNQLNLRQRSKRSNNAKLLYVMRSFEATQFSNFVKCLRQTNQKTVARALENGGGVIKVQVQSRVAECMNIRQLHQNIEDFRNRTAPWSYETDKFITDLTAKDIEILKSKLDKQTVVIWIWCRSQEAVKNLQKLYESNKLRKILFDFANIRPSTPEIIQSIVINIDSDQFKKTVAVSPMCRPINLIDGIGDRSVIGITKLRSEIYVVYTSAEKKLSDPRPDEIRVYEDRNPIRLKRKIEEQEIGDIYDIGSSEKDNCVYLSVRGIWKLTKETDHEYKIIKWLTLDYDTTTLSVSRNGHLLLINNRNLMIYGSDAELIRSIQLPSDFGFINHAVETSIGNIIILHRLEEEKIGWSMGERWPDYAISELTSDGQMIVRRFISSDEGHVIGPCHLSLDSDDQVFLADSSNNRVILFDSDLKWNQILCAKEADEGGRRKGSWPMRMCYDEKNHQLIVGGYYIRGIIVYSLSRK